MSPQDGAAISWKQTGRPGAAQQREGSERTASRGSGGIALQTQPWCGAYAVTSDAFGPALVGAKSLNTLKLKVHRAVSQARHLPPSTLITISPQAPLLLKHLTETQWLILHACWSSFGKSVGKQACDWAILESCLTRFDMW